MKYLVLQMQAQLVSAKEVPQDSQINQIYQRIDQMETTMLEILENGRDMDDNLSSQLEEIRELQQTTLKKIRRSSWSSMSKTILAIGCIGLVWIVVLYSTISAKYTY